jgi:hypothetical protein
LEKTPLKKMLNWMLVGTLAMGGLAACGSDDDDDSPAKTEATTAGTNAGDQGSDNADVAAYCKQAEEVAKALKDVMSDPTKGDLQQLSQEAQDLVQRAAELTSANASDTEEINACSAKISDAMGG